MPARPVRPRPASAHVTVWTAEGVPIQYPKAQIHRIDKSERLFMEKPDTPAVVDVTPEVSHPAPLGGGWYELSDGTRVRSIEDAQEQQEELDA